MFRCAGSSTLLRGEGLGSFASPGEQGLGAAVGCWLGAADGAAVGCWLDAVSCAAVGAAVVMLVLVLAVAPG